MGLSEIRKEYKNKKRQARKGFRKIKREYKLQKKELRENYHNDLENYFETEEFKAKANPPRRATLEEIGNAITHGLGSVFAVIAFILMMIMSDSVAEYVGAGIYFFGLFVMFTMSCLYHSFRYGRKVKRIFRRFDYSSIYLLIGATFAPILLCFIGGMYGAIFCTVQWLIIATGITFIGVFGPTKLRWLHFPLYMVLGWSALLFIPKMLANNIPVFLWILAGGIVYTLGIIPFAMNKKVSHFIWHIFVLAGAVIQWTGIYLYIYCI